jgi:hypothetical protein
VTAQDDKANVGLRLTNSVRVSTIKQSVAISATSGQVIKDPEKQHYVPLADGRHIQIGSINIAGFNVQPTCRARNVKRFASL